MRAVRFHDYLGLDGVRVETAPRPVAGPAEILIEVHAAGVNPFDWYAVEGYVNDYVQFSLPAILGRDFSGIVAAIGAGVTAFAIGDAVYGHADASADGSFADYVAVPADRAVMKPDSLSHIDAASLPNVLMAAWDGLFSADTGMNLQSGQTVLINGAAGGIGTVAVQLARWRGARVIGTASPGNHPLLYELGAAAAYDYHSADWDETAGKVDAVLDTADGSTAERLCALIRPGGSYVSLRGMPSPEFVAARSADGVRCIAASGPNSASALPEMAAAVAQGAVKPIVSETFPLDRVRDALEAVRAGHVRGKIVIVVHPENHSI